MDEVVFDARIDPRIGDWVQLTPQRTAVLLPAAKRGESTVYFNVKTKEVSAQPPREFGGIDWVEVTGSFGSSDAPAVPTFRNRHTGEITTDRGVVAAAVAAAADVPSWVTQLEQRVDAAARERDLAARKDAMRAALAEERRKRGCDPFTGNPPPVRVVLPTEVSRKRAR